MLVINNLPTYLQIPNGAGPGQSLMLLPKGQAKVQTPTPELLKAQTNKLVTLKDDSAPLHASGESKVPRGKQRPAKGR